LDAHTQPHEAAWRADIALVCGPGRGAAWEGEDPRAGIHVRRASKAGRLVGVPPDARWSWAPRAKRGSMRLRFGMSTKETCEKRIVLNLSIHMSSISNMLLKMHGLPSKYTYHFNIHGMD
jgi:hypothetical protein